MELIAVELDATDYVEVTGAELVGGTNLDSGRSRRMEHGHDRKRESRRERHEARVGAPVESVPRGTWMNG
jgi:hypothetical protein